MMTIAISSSRKIMAYSPDTTGLSRSLFNSRQSSLASRSGGEGAEALAPFQTIPQAMLSKALENQKRPERC